MCKNRSNATSTNSKMLKCFKLKSLEIFDIWCHYVDPLYQLVTFRVEILSHASYYVTSNHEILLLLLGQPIIVKYNVQDNNRICTKINVWIVNYFI
jgi:hypothetical protein